MGKLRYLVRKTDQISRDLINSDLRKLGMAAKNLADHAFMLRSGLGFGTYFLKFFASLLILDRTSWKTNMLTVLLVSYIFLSLPTVVFSFSRIPSTGVKGDIILVAGCIQLFGFSTFKACVGTFWPSIMNFFLYAVYHDPEGLKAIADRVHLLAGVFTPGLKKLSTFDVHEPPFFDIVKIKCTHAKAICGSCFQEEDEFEDCGF